MPEISEEELSKLKAAAASAKDLEDEAKALRASKERVLNESNDYKTKYKAAQELIDAKEKERLEADGKLSELLNKEREENKKLLSQLGSTTSKVLVEKLRTEVSKYAKDAHDVDMLLKVADHKKLLEVDEENFEVKGTEAFVKKCRETHGYLFAKKQMDPGDNNPPKGDEEDTKTNDEKYLVELQQCRSSEELKKIKRKYGKPVEY